MTRAQVNEIIKTVARAHGFEPSETRIYPERLIGIISEELNFSFTALDTENTDWAAHRVEKSLTVSASVRKMGGYPTVEELLKTADEIKRGAELVEELNSMAITWEETF